MIDFSRYTRGERERILSAVQTADHYLQGARASEATKQEVFDNSFYKRVKDEDIVSCGRNGLKGTRGIVKGLAVASIGVAMGAEWVYQIVTGAPRDLSYLNQLGVLGQLVKYDVALFGNSILEPVVASIPLIGGIGYASDISRAERKWQSFFRSQTPPMEGPIEVPLTKENVDELDEEMKRFETECGKIERRNLSDEKILPDSGVLHIDD